MISVDHGLRCFVIVLRGHETSESLGQRALTSARANGWNALRFDAIDGRTAGERLLQEQNLASQRSSTKCIAAMKRPGVIGCLLSHYHLWKLCLDINEPIGIFEHDVIFLDRPKFSMDFDHVLRFDKLQAGKNHGTGTWYRGSHAYMIRPMGARRLIDWCHAQGVSPSDVMLGSDIVNIEFDPQRLVVLDAKSGHSLTERKDF